MSGGFLTRYSQIAFSPEYRASLFIDGEPRLTWTSLFLDAFPNADIYLVGGTLRDVVLGRVPNDIDLVIRNISVEELSRWLRAHGAFEVAGKRFGTFKFSPHGCVRKSPIDIALPRTEFIGNSHASGRRDLEIDFDPKLSIEDDLSRRDFTVNAMAFDIHRGTFIDPFDGLSDLHDGIIRSVRHPSERFYEDATRVLRGLRFASQLGFGIEEHTWRALTESVSLLNTTTLLENGKHGFVIPREAIGKEFLLGFIAHPTHTLTLWMEAGALNMFLPEIANLAPKQLQQTLHTLHLLEKPAFLAAHNMKCPTATGLVAALFVFLDDDPKSGAYHVCKNLYLHQFPKNHSAYVDCKAVLWMTESLRVFEEKDPANMRPSFFEKQFCNERGEDLLLVMHAMYVASGEHSVARERLHTARRILEKMKHHICPTNGPKLEELISGHDLKDMGVPEGPQIREIKNSVRDAQLTHQIHTKKEAKEHVRKLLKA